ncbi:MAG: ABC transporter permease [Pseudomonadota bacterium]
MAAAELNTVQTKPSALRHVAHEITDTLNQWRVWFLMGNQDILMRYRRSRLGPFWISLSMASTVIGIGVLYSGIFEAEVGPYLAFIGAGFLIWAFIGGGLVEGCGALIEAEQHIRSVRVSTSVLCARIIWRNTIIFLHNFVLISLILMFVGLRPGPEAFLILPGVALLAMFLFACANVLGPLTLKYRDIAQIVSSLTQFMFFLTPILWMPDQGRVPSAWVLYNPFFHLIELVRAPMLGQLPTVMNWSVSAGCTLIAGLLACWTWVYSRNRIFVWL